jgi:AraC-like DNA-binding protein
MMNQPAYTLVNPQNGNLAFKLLYFEDGRHFDHIQRNNYYTILWITTGAGNLKADFSEYEVAANNLMAFSPYQPFMLSGANLRGVAIHFHPDFYCIHKHQAEVACNGVLFNNIYQPPFVAVDEVATATFNMVIQQMEAGVQQVALAQYELIVSYLKIFLITASRLKTQQQVMEKGAAETHKEPFILQTLKDAIERDFKTIHSPAEYANALNISPKALAKLTRTHLNKTPGDLIAERIIIEAKRELYLTNKTVKEIAYGLGYDDEYYFSRFFKTNAEVSPQFYRETVGFGRAV